LKDSKAAVAPATGKLGILTPGLGAVATTFMAGVEAVRRGKSKPIGSLTQMATIRLGKRTDARSPLIKDFVPLTKLEDIVFGAWDPIPDDAYTAAKKAGVLEERDLEPIKDFLSAIKPMPAVFENKYVTRLNGTNVKKGKTKRDLAEQLRQDMRDFKAKNKCDRLVIVWCASTEIFIKPGPQHATIAQFEKAMENNDEAISPSMLYAWAAIMEGVPYCNGAPNLAVDTLALQELANQKGVPISGKDFKTGQTWMKTVLDEHPRQPGRRSARRSRVVQDQGRVEALGAPHHSSAREVPGPVQGLLARRAHQLLPAARRQQGRLGQHRHRRMDGLSDADQGQLPLPRFHPRRADRARPRAVLGLRAPRRDEGHSGMVKLLLQVAHGRCRPRAGT
jgi:hypothetical protein